MCYITVCVRLLVSCPCYCPAVCDGAAAGPQLSLRLSVDKTLLHERQT